MSTPDELRKAMHRAFSLGEVHWRQADSESYKQNKLADETHAKFLALVEETCSALSARPLPQAAVSEEAPAEESLRSLACWLGVGGYNAPTVDAKVFEQKIAAMREFCEQHGIEWEEPAWHIFSLWG